MKVLDELRELEEYLNSLEWVFEDDLIDYSIALSIMESRAEEVFLNKKPQLIQHIIAIKMSGIKNIIV
jgi:hypothetical protein